MKKKRFSLVSVYNKTDLEKAIEHIDQYAPKSIIVVNALENI